MGYINQALNNRSFPDEAALDIIGGADGSSFGNRSGKPAGSYKPTCPWTPVQPGCQMGNASTPVPVWPGGNASTTGSGCPGGDVSTKEPGGGTRTSAVFVSTNDANKTASTIALVEGAETNVLTAAVNVDKVTNTYKIDSNVNVNMTLKATTPPCNVTFTVVCSLYRGTNLLATHTEVRTVYAATDEEIPWSDGITMTWVDTPAVAENTTYTIRIKVSAASGTVKAEASTRSISIIQL